MKTDKVQLAGILADGKFTFRTERSKITVKASTGLDQVQFSFDMDGCLMQIEVLRAADVK